MIFFSKKGEELILFFIICFGFLLRVLFLDKFPVGFHSQEAIIGYRAFSLANTARDELGRLLPILFTSFKDYQLPFPTYLTIPFIKIFGFNEWSTRLPFAILGTLAIPAIYGITKIIFPEKKVIALWAAFFLTINPWSVFLSRTTSEIALAFDLFLIGFWILLYSQKRLSFLTLSLLFFLGSLYSSKVAWFFLPIFLAIFLFTSIARNFLIGKIKLKLVFFITLIFLWLPILIICIKAPSVKQSLFFNDFSFFSDISTINYINQMRGESITGGVPILGQLFFNKSFYLFRLFENFLVHFNPRFLFAGGSEQPLIGLTNFGPILVAFLPVTVLGLVILLRKNHKNFLLLAWAILAILPSVFVYPTLNQERLIFLLPPVAFISAIGITNLKSKWIFALWIFFLMFNIAFVIYDTAVKEPKRTQKAWFYGYKNAASFIKPMVQSYDEILVTNSYAQDPGPLLLFFLKIPPQTLWQSSPLNNKLVFRNWIQKIDNIQIGKIEDRYPGKQNKKVLFVSTPEETESLPSNLGLVLTPGEKKILPTYIVLESIKDLEGNVILQIGKFLSYDKNGKLIEE